ncbi:MAG: hypothetical protein IT326_07585 [Anaerolineae bacterium]|nr:hypothetical protein [Anaerolineae bacterium]
MTHDIAVTSVPSMDVYVVDDVPQPTLLGSCGVYIAIMLARLGADTVYAGPVGDGFDPAVLAPLQAVGLNVRLTRMPGPVATLRLIGHASGQIDRAIYDPGAGYSFTADRLDPAFWDSRAYWLGTAPYPLQLAVAARGHATGVPVYLTTQGEFAGKYDDLAKLIPDLSLLFTNTGELINIGFGGLVKSLHTLRELNPSLQMTVTRGKRGAWFIDGDEIHSIPAYPMPESINVVGAGDTFAGTFIHGGIRGMPIDERLRCAAAAAALKLRGFSYGGQPSEMELAAWLAEIRPHLPVEQVRWGGAEAEAWFRAEADIVEKR